MKKWTWRSKEAVRRAKRNWDIVLDVNLAVRVWRQIDEASVGYFVSKCCRLPVSAPAIAAEDEVTAWIVMAVVIGRDRLFIGR